MSTAILKFDNYEMPYNPKSINVYKDKTDEGEVTVISATGEIYGENCSLYISQFEELFRTKKQGILYLPESGVFTAEIMKFDYSFSTLPGLAQYSFTFRQILKQGGTVCAYYTAKNGETLWSISKKLNCSVDTLIKLNQGFLNSYIVNSGDTVIVPNNAQEVLL